MASENSLPPGFQDMLAFGLVEALMGRRARRFPLGSLMPHVNFRSKPNVKIYDTLWCF